MHQMLSNLVADILTNNLVVEHRFVEAPGPLVNN
jgi:hypothetical protein